MITAGTFLNGLMHIGRKTVAGGRCAEPASTFLTASLAALGIEHQRMKTGTPGSSTLEAEIYREARASLDLKTAAALALIETLCAMTVLFI